MFPDGTTRIRRYDDLEFRAVVYRSPVHRHRSKVLVRVAQLPTRDRLGQEEHPSFASDRSRHQPRMPPSHLPHPVRGPTQLETRARSGPWWKPLPSRPGVPCASCNGCKGLSQRRRAVRRSESPRLCRREGCPSAPPVAWAQSCDRRPPGHREPHPLRPGEPTADHPVPLVLGGEPLPARPGELCASCNARKGLSQRRRRRPTPTQYPPSRL
jgi:hypothetical protein